MGDGMLKKLSIRKIMLSSLALFAMFLIYIIPANENTLDIKEELEYVNTNVESSPIFLMDQNSYMALTSVAVNDTNIENKAKQLIKVLTIGGMDSKIPSGFSAIIPPNTEVLSLSYEDGLIKVDFSKAINAIGLATSATVGGLAGGMIADTKDTRKAKLKDPRTV